MHHLSKKDLLYVVTIFLSAFLLFFVQPMMGKYLLPLFGGGSSVWAVTLVFFQSFLLLGYAYAHILSKLPSKTQKVIHLTLFAVSILLLPILPENGATFNEAFHPIVNIFLFLSLTVGLPYLLLASTSPLLQSWFSRSHSKASTYKLYAVSNGASLLALLGYPFLFEPWFSLSVQATLWTVLFVLFIVLIFLLLPTISKIGEMNEADTDQKKLQPPPSSKDTAMWVLLAAAGSMLLVAITNQMSLDIAPVPFLWVLPLSLYLLSFVITFESTKWYKRKWFLPLFIWTTLWFSYMIFDSFHTQQAPFIVQINIYSIMLFVGAMMCHGELSKLKPSGPFVTKFYLALAGGGALGGAFVAIVAPFVFPTIIELPIALLFALGLVLFLSLREKESIFYTDDKLRLLLKIYAGSFFVFLVIFSLYTYQVIHDPVEIRRNFYGVWRLKEADVDDPERHRYQLLHGNTIHGTQYLESGNDSVPTTYYGLNSGVATVFAQFEKEYPLRVGVVGLGAGTLAAYGDENDVMKFYEIDKDAQYFAETYFTYLDHFPGEYEVVIGDARVQLGKEEDQAFDVLILDAFTSDAVPTHLLTKEAFDLYLRHVKADGIIAVHVSNRHLDLPQVIRALKNEFQLSGEVVLSIAIDPKESTNTWAILSPSLETIASIPLGNTGVLDERESSIELWTDNYSNLYRIF